MLANQQVLLKKSLTWVVVGSSIVEGCTFLKDRPIPADKLAPTKQGDPIPNWIRGCPAKLTMYYTTKRDAQS